MRVTQKRAGTVLWVLCARRIESVIFKFDLGIISLCLTLAAVRENAILGVNAHQQIEQITRQITYPSRAFQPPEGIIPKHLVGSLFEHIRIICLTDQLRIFHQQPLEIELSAAFFISSPGEKFPPVFVITAELIILLLRRFGEPFAFIISRKCQRQITRTELVCRDRKRVQKLIVKLRKARPVSLFCF